MRYENEVVRRQDRLLNEEGALALLRAAEYGVLSVQAEEGGGYGIPIHFAWDGAGSLFFHCAPEGRKLRCLKRCPRASFCIVGAVRTRPRQFGTDYESLILHGTARADLDDEERMSALLLLAAKYLPEDPEACRKCAEALFRRTDVIRMDVEAWTGKKCSLKH